MSPPLASVDVVIIGGGASGLAAASAALELGATILVLERNAQLGGAGINAGNFFACGTRWQAAAGIKDSPEQALAEWEDFTIRGDASNPWVSAFLYSTEETLDWMSSYGGGFGPVSHDPGAGETARIHPLQRRPGENGVPLQLLGETLLEEEVWLKTTAVALRADASGQVRGVEIVQTDGTTGWVAAGAVVVATGGFARSDARVYAAIPELVAFPRHVEAWPGMDGNGLDLVESVGGRLENLDGVTLYAHGTTDAIKGQPEVMVIGGLTEAAVVSLSGERVMDEDDLRAVWGGRTMLSEGPLYAIFDSARWQNTMMMGLGYNYAQITDGSLTAEAYAEALGVPSADTVGALAVELGMPPEQLSQTIAEYNVYVERGDDQAFGKDFSALSRVPLVSPPYFGLPLALATGKSFGGAALDLEARVLDTRDVPIPGLYAAGEVAGVLGGDHIGMGISGSITAVLFSGRQAGASAAAYAAARR